MLHERRSALAGAALLYALAAAACSGRRPQALLEAPASTEAPAPSPPSPSGSASAPATPTPDPSAVAAASTSLRRWLALRELSLAQVRSQLSVAEKSIHTDTSYEKLAHLTELHEPDHHPDYFFFFRGDKLAMLYVIGSAEVHRMSAPALYTTLGGRGDELRSRTCKHCIQHVYPAKGVAFSSEGDEVNFVEIFQPTTLEAYRGEIYIEPGSLIR